jgi:hypothetical protein
VDVGQENGRRDEEVARQRDRREDAAAAAVEPEQERARHVAREEVVLGEPDLRRVGGERETGFTIASQAARSVSKLAPAFTSGASIGPSPVSGIVTPRSRLSQPPTQSIRTPAARSRTSSATATGT